MGESNDTDLPEFQDGRIGKSEEPVVRAIPIEGNKHMYRDAMKKLVLGDIGIFSGCLVSPLGLYAAGTGHPIAGTTIFAIGVMVSGFGGGEIGKGIEELKAYDKSFNPMRAMYK